MNFMPVIVENIDGIHFLHSITLVHHLEDGDEHEYYYVAHVALAKGGFITVPLSSVKNMPFQIGEKKMDSGIILPGQQLPGGFN